VGSTTDSLAGTFLYGDNKNTDTAVTATFYSMQLSLR